MSRIGRKPVPVPQGVEVILDGDRVTVKGPLGVLERRFPEGITVERENDSLIVKRRSDQPRDKAMHGLCRTLLNNMVIGVTQGFTKSLEVIGVGYRAAKQGRKLALTVGYSQPVEIEPPPGLEIEVPAATRITVRGIDKERVGQLAAYIRSMREPEPYKGKGIRYEHETIRRKAGKAGGKGKK
ncbi:MAG TPA: 50S ribosomal protein L6 [Desulfotomaculum sp.]|nr:50S ribosomal protein L6 [Desulfotomaculum sp.]